LIAPIAALFMLYAQGAFVAGSIQLSGSQQFEIRQAINHVSLLIPLWC
jgi:hypothetical protein